jgi:DNA-binding NarL/FixJ family response regulator
LSANAQSLPELRVLVVDDHPMFRRGLIDVIGQIPRCRGLVEVENIDEALHSLATGKVDIVLADISLSHGTGFELLEILNTKYPGTPLIFLTMDSQPSSVLRALELGAKGYLTKSADASEIRDAIVACLAGRNYIHSSVAHCLIDQLRPSSAEEPEPLTNREQEVLEKIAQGLDSDAVRQALGISTSTFKTHVRSIYRKLGVTSRTQLTIKALQLNLVAKQATTPSP